MSHPSHPLWCSYSYNIGGDYILWSSSLCNFLQSYATPSSLRANTGLLNTPLSNPYISYFIWKTLFFMCYLRTVSVSRLYSVWTLDGWLIGKDSEGSDRGLFKVLSWNLSRGTEQNHESPLWGKPVSRPRFELSTYRIQVHSITMFEVLM